MRDAQQEFSPDQPEMMSLASLDIAAQRREALLQVFPEIRLDDGRIDFERLRLALGDAVPAGVERYALTWPGKAECFRVIQAPSLGTLRPCPTESVDFDNTQNLMIEGDNLEVLKLLQKSYLGKVKVIYIDPPYNTGGDFIYPDNYSESLETYLQYTGQVDTAGKRFGTNTDTDGRFHSKWLSLMYPRLYLARNLMREDGVIFISIDEKELANLRRLCDEVFGEDNRIGIIAWKNVTDNNPTLITSDNEFIVAYARSREALPSAWSSRFSAAKDVLLSEYERLKKEGMSPPAIERHLREFIADNEESVGFLSRYKHVDELGIYTGSESVHNPRPGGYDFEILHPTTGKAMRKPANGYRFPQATFSDMVDRGVILYGPDEKRIVKIKKYLADYVDVLRSVVTLDGRLGTYELKRLFPECGTIFTNPKPTELIESLISFASDEDSLVLDFFAGSGSTGHATMDLNRKTGGSRRFILVQLPEPTNEDSAAKACGLATIAEITKERLRRVAALQSARDAQSDIFSNANHHTDKGFRVFRLAESNFLTWQADRSVSADELAKQLELHVNHVREGRGINDLLYEVLLKSGFPLATPIGQIRIDDKQAYSIDDGALLICLEPRLTLELVRALADLRPERVVCLDSGFDSDQLKANAGLIFKSKGVISFRTV